MKKIYTASLPNSAALRADSGQLGTEILMPASSIGIPQKYTTIATPEQVALLGSEDIPLNIPDGSFVCVGGYLYYELGAFDDIDSAGSNMVISNNNGSILTKQVETPIVKGEILVLQPYTLTASFGGRGSGWSLTFDTPPVNTNLGRLQITLYLIPLDLAIP